MKRGEGWATCPNAKISRSLTVARGRTEKGKELTELLGFGEDFVDEMGYFKNEFNFDKIFPVNERGLIDNVDEHVKACKTIYANLGEGERLTKSYCIGLGIKGNVPLMAYALLTNAYVGGFSVCEVVTPSTIRKANAGVEESADFTLIDALHRRDVVVCMLAEGAFHGEIASIKGLMQTRAVYGKPTIVLTTWTMQACSNFLDSEPRYDMATPVFPIYKKSEIDEDLEGLGYSNTSSSYLNNITGVKNGQKSVGDYF